MICFLRESERGCYYSNIPISISGTWMLLLIQDSFITYPSIRRPTLASTSCRWSRQFGMPWIVPRLLRIPQPSKRLDHWLSQSSRLWCTRTKKGTMLKIISSSAGSVRRWHNRRFSATKWPLVMKSILRDTPLAWRRRTRYRRRVGSLYPDLCQYF